MIQVVSPPGSPPPPPPPPINVQIFGLGATPVPRFGISVVGNITRYGGSGLPSVSVSMGGQSFNVTNVALPSQSSTFFTFSWTGNVPASVLPGQAFTIIVSVSGVKPPVGPGVTQELFGGASVSVVLENVVPTATFDLFQTPAATADPTYAFTFKGRLKEIFANTQNAAPSGYTPRADFVITNKATNTTVASATAVFTPDAGSTNAGAWVETAVPLVPGDYTITVTARDQFTSAAPITQSLTVYRYDRATESKTPGLPTTAVGIPTSASVTTWTRLEPQVSGADFDVTTRARLFDPLWMMTRQWQIGEFQGEDTGTPVQARARATNAIFSRYHPGELTANDTAPLAYRPNQWPLEMMVERRTMMPARTIDVEMLPATVDAALHFLRMLDHDPVGAKYRAAFAAKYPMAPLTAAAAASVDPDTLRFIATMCGRAPDSRQLYAALSRARAADFQFDATLGIAAADVAAVQAVVVNWLGYYSTLFTQPSGDNAWTPSRLEYAAAIGARFSAAATDDLTLSASEFGGGWLDWSAFDVNSKFKLTTTGDAGFTSIVSLAMPAPVTVKGAPAQRYWELEDANVAYGLLSAGPTDLAHLMMVEYAGSYGNDWFVMPMTVPVGSVTRVNSLVVTDSFGVQTLLRPMGDPALPPAFFSLWQLSNRRFLGDSRPQPTPNLFFLPPSIGGVLDGGILEDVMFLRDEMANLAWGVERSIEGGLGTSLSLTNAAPPPPDPAPHYVVETTVPNNWVPLMPVQVDANGTVQLKLGSTLQLDGSNAVKTARSRVLNAAANLTIYDEEVPREGARVTQRRRMARWTDGSTWVWTAFQNEIGSGEGSAGLLFDQAGDPEPTT